MPTPLEVYSDLQLAVDGDTIDVQAQGDEIIVDLPTLRSGRRLLAPDLFSGRTRSKRARRLHDALQNAGLTLDVRLAGDSIARIGRGARPGRLGTLLNLEGVELHPTRSLRSVARRRPILSGVVGGVLAVALGWLLLRAFRS